MALNENKRKISIGTIGLWVIFGIVTIVMTALIWGDVFQPSEYWIPLIPVGILSILAVAATIIDVTSQRKVKVGLVGIWTIFGITVVVFLALIMGDVFQPSEYWIPMIPVGTLLILAIIPTILEYTSAEVRFCPKCGKILIRKGDFCQECGTRILMTCPTCGMKIKGNPKFCFKCGGNLSDVEIIKPSISNIKLSEEYSNICKQCGSPSKPEAKYCVFCGFQL
jgi:predicted RNA-binding Zn-ribbon protein involved in translation (DUF1610 family)